MGLNIYFAHSVPSHKATLLEKLPPLAGELGIDLFVGERPWPSLHDVPTASIEALGRADVYVAWFLKDGPYIYYANMEGDCLRARWPDKPVILFLERDILPPDVLRHQSRIHYEFESPGKAVFQLYRAVDEDLKAKFDPEKRARLYGFLLGALSRTLLLDTVGQRSVGHDARLPVETSFSGQGV